MTLVLISSYCAFWRCRGRCPQRPSGPSIIQSQSRYAVAAAPQNNTELAYGQRTDVGICPYNVSTAQNTEGTRHSLPFHGFRIPATFAKIPTCTPRLSGGVRTVTQLVQSVMNASSAKLHKQGTVRCPTLFQSGTRRNGRNVAKRKYPKSSKKKQRHNHLFGYASAFLFLFLNGQSL